MNEALYDSRWPFRPLRRKVISKLPWDFYFQSQTWTLTVASLGWWPSRTVEGEEGGDGGEAGGSFGYSKRWMVLLNKNSRVEELS